MLKRIVDILGVILDARFWNRSFPVSHGWSDYLEIQIKQKKPIQFFRENGYKPEYTIGNAVFVMSPGYDSSNWGNPAAPYVYTVPRRSVALKLRKLVKKYEREKLEKEICEGVFNNFR